MINFLFKGIICEAQISFATAMTSKGKKIEAVRHWLYEIERNESMFGIGSFCHGESNKFWDMIRYK